MKKLITIIATLFLLSPAVAFCQTAESKTSPQTIQKIAPGQFYYNYNITEVQKETVDGGEAETFYQYNYVEIKGKPTKAKVLAAIKAANDTAEADSDTAVNLATAKADMKTSILAGKTDAQIAAYITNNVTDLQSTKVFLYRLTKEVRDIIKRNGWE